MIYDNDIFISYSFRDRSSVKQLVRVLETQRFKVWVFETGIKPGEGLVEEISKAIEKSRYHAVWLTKSALKSSWVKEEWQEIFTAQIHGKPTLLPLRGEDIELPRFLRAKKYIDFVKSFDEGLEELTRVLDKDSAKRIQECIQGLIGVREPEKCAEELANLAIRRSDEEAVWAIWTGLQGAKKMTMRVGDCCSSSLVEVVAESLDPKVRNAALDIIMNKSLASGVENIIDKLAYAAGDIADRSKTKRKALARKMSSFIVQCTNSSDPFIQKSYLTTKKRLEELDSCFFQRFSDGDSR